MKKSRTPTPRNASVSRGPRIVTTLTGLLILAACGDAQSNEGLVARAGDHDLTVDQTVQLLVDQENLPNQTEVVHALADLWVDYTLLARAVARDSTLTELDVEPLIRRQLEQQVIAQHMDSVLQVDTAITESELREAYEREAPEARLHARHILLGYPEQATQAQRDSVRQELESLRQRVLGGESFETLATRYSQDSGSASQGGDLGTFGRGDMVRPFEEAAFALQPGDVSNVVETPFGMHIIRVESKEVPGFDSVRDAYRQRMQSQRFVAAESSYVATVEEAAAPSVSENAYDVLKELARDPGTQLSGRAAERPLVSFEGGAFTVGEYQLFIQSQQPQLRGRIQNATDEQLDDFLDGMAQRELMVEEARKAGLQPDRQRVDSLVTETRKQILLAAQEIGLRELDRAPGEALAPAVGRAVRQSLQDILVGAKNVVPLGPIAFQLRSRASAAVFDAGVGQVVLRIGQERAARGPSDVERGPEPPAAADTAGGPGTP
jgi:parvulin-like peptidyl-prolyl isomerase